MSSNLFQYIDTLVSNQIDIFKSVELSHNFTLEEYTKSFNKYHEQYPLYFCIIRDSVLRKYYLAPTLNADVVHKVYDDVTYYVPTWDNVNNRSHVMDESTNVIKIELPHTQNYLQSDTKDIPPVLPHYFPPGLPFDLPHDLPHDDAPNDTFSVPHDLPHNVIGNNIFYVARNVQPSTLPSDVQYTANHKDANFKVKYGCDLTPSLTKEQADENFKAFMSQVEKQINDKFSNRFYKANGIDNEAKDKHQCKAEIDHIYLQNQYENKFNILTKLNPTEFNKVFRYKHSTAMNIVHNYKATTKSYDWKVPIQHESYVDCLSGSECWYENVSYMTDRTLTEEEIKTAIKMEFPDMVVFSEEDKREQPKKLWEAEVDMFNILYASEIYRVVGNSHCPIITNIQTHVKYYTLLYDKLTPYMFHQNSAIMEVFVQLFYTVFNTLCQYENASMITTALNNKYFHTKMEITNGCVYALIDSQIMNTFLDKLEEHVNEDNCVEKYITLFRKMNKIGTLTVTNFETMIKQSIFSKCLYECLTLAQR